MKASLFIILIVIIASKMGCCHEADDKKRAIDSIIESGMPKK